MSQCYRAQAPGSLMLFGEHAVLRGYTAIAASVKSSITVTLQPLVTKKIIINSELLGEYNTSLDDFVVQEPFEYVLAAIQDELSKIPTGFNLHIKSDFSDQLGLGSSAAVVVATLKVLHEWLGLKIKALDLVALGREVIHKVQGFGSGADIAASVYEGVIAIKNNPLRVTRLKNYPPLSVVYSGSKTKTSIVVAKVNELEAKYPLVAHIFKAMDDCSKQAIDAINHKDWQKLGQLANIHQGLQDALGVNNKALAAIIFKLREHPNIYGAKISGSGLGDCVIGIGDVMISTL